jgi:hypothetical protein
MNIRELYEDKLVVVKPEAVKEQFRDLQFRLFIIERIDGESVHGRWVVGCTRDSIRLSDIERLPRREDILCLTPYEEKL